MAAIATFTKWVRASVPGCPEPIIEDAVRQSAIEYATQTRILSEFLTVTTAAGVNTYPLTPSVPLEVINLLDVSRSVYDHLKPSDRREHELSTAIDSSPKFYYGNAVSDLVVYPTPVGVETLTVKAIVAPKDGAATLPDELLVGQRYLHVAEGAIARLLSMAAVPWSNPQQGMLERMKFDAAIADEQVKLAKGSGPKRLRTKLTIF